MPVLDARRRYKVSCACIGHGETCYLHNLYSVVFESIRSGRGVGSVEIDLQTKWLHNLYTTNKV